MKSNTICQVILAGSIILASCQSNNSAKQDESQQTMNETVMNKVTDCKISAGNITFTNAINGAENCVKLLDDGALECIMQPTFLSILVIHFGKNWHLNRMNTVTTVLLQ